MKGNDFGLKLEQARRKVKTLDEKTLSQESAARLVGASLAAYRSWEKGRKLPIAIYRGIIAKLWPEVFI